MKKTTWEIHGCTKGLECVDCGKRIHKKNCHHKYNPMKDCDGKCYLKLKEKENEN